MIKDLWGKIAYYWFIFILIFVGLFVPKTYALTTITPTQQNHSVEYNIGTCLGTNSCGDFVIEDSASSGWLSGNSYTNFCPSDKVCHLTKDYYYAKFSQSFNPGQAYVLNFNTWVSYREPQSYYNNLNYYMIASNTGEYNGSSSGALQSFTCRVGIEEGTTSKLSWSCTFIPSQQINYLYLRITFPSVRNQVDFFSYGINNGSVVYDNSTADSINAQTQVIQDSTNTIINNNNNNTQQIIDSNNQNTQAIIDSNMSCKFYDKSSVGLNGYFLTDRGVETTSQYWAISDYIKIDSDSKIYLIDKETNNYSCFYNINKTLISCISNNSMNLNEILTIPTNASYFRFSLSLTRDKPKFKICKNGSQATTDSIDNLKDTIDDDSTEDPTDDFSDMEDMIATNGVITNLISLPVTLYTKVLNNINGTCSSQNLGSLYGTDLIIPCIDVDDYLGSTLWNTIDIIISGFFVWYIARKMIKVFNNFSSMKEGDVIGD